MKYTFLLTLFIFSINSLFAQPRFRFLEKQAGVEFIETSSISGTAAAPKTKIEETKSFDKAGNLTKIVSSRGSTVEYLYFGATIIEYIQFQGNDCKTAWEYHVSRDSNNLIIKKKFHTGKYKPENACEQSMSDRTIVGTDVSHLFKDVKKTFSRDDDFDNHYIIDKKNPIEYTMYCYNGSSKYNRYSLVSIEKVEKDETGNYVRSNFDFQKYPRPQFFIDRQIIIDEFGFHTKSIGEKKLYENDGNLYQNFAYEKDKRQNWTKQSLITPVPDQVFERIRKIKYRE